LILSTSIAIDVIPSDCQVVPLYATNHVIREEPCSKQEAEKLFWLKIIRAD